MNESNFQNKWREVVFIRLFFQCLPFKITNLDDAVAAFLVWAKLFFGAGT